MITLLQEQFDFQIIDLKKLNGYDNVNYKMVTNNANYILKTYHFTNDQLALAEAENKALLFLNDGEQKTLPTPIPFNDGSFVKTLHLEGEKTIFRVLSYLEGNFLGDVEFTPNLLNSLGRLLASVDIQLQSFNNYTIQARVWEWDLQYFYLNKKYIDDISNVKDRNIVRYFFQQFEENVTPVIPTLRKSIIHNDANEWNILVENEKITGLIDFGDLAYSLLINELAIAITYACFDKEAPLEWASILLKSYHELLPIEKQELDVLYYLVAARLCTSVCNAAHSKKINPNNEYASVSEKSAWDMLHRWQRINPIKAKNHFRSSVGYPVNKPEPIEKIVKRRYDVISPIISLSYDQPIYMESAAFQYMYDANGTTFLDAYNNIPHVGHTHPKVVEAGRKQMAKLNTNTRYAYDLLPEYAEKLLSKFPSTLNKVYFVNSGSAASDLAMRLAYAHTKHKKIMVMEHGYHGNTMMSMDISDYKFSNKKGQGKKDYILKTPIPDTYRGKYKSTMDGVGKQYANEAIKSIKNSELPIAAFISEPIVGCGGQVPLAEGYLKELYPAIRMQGGVCISDEVQTGFGRLGDYFWGFEAQEVVPDIVIIGKPMANGHPMGAVITTTEIAESFSEGVEFFSSFGGNPVSCAIGLSVLEVIEEEKLQENAKMVGDYYKSLFISLQKKYSCIGDVRGTGLFIGVEITKNNSLEPDTKLAHTIKNELRDKGILISTDGPWDSVLKTKPPLCFTKENAELVVNCIENILDINN